MTIPTVKLPIDSAGDSSTVTVTFPFADLLNGDTLSTSQAGLQFTSWSPPNQPAVTFGTPTQSGSNWINDVTITGAKAGKTFYCYCRAETVGGQTLVSQVNVQTTGVNPLANSPVTSVVQSSTATPNVYLPNGWDATWKAKKATIGTTPAYVTVVGDSILAGGLASDLNSTGIRSLLRSKLMNAYGTYCDFFPNFNGAFTGWSSNGPTTNERWGFGYLTVPNGSGGTNTLTFLSPYPCTQIDIIYFDSWPGTWSYNIDGGGNQIVTNQNQNTGSSATYCIKRLTLSGLSKNTHSIVFASQSASFTCAILGVICYPNGSTGGGIGYAPLTYAGTLLTDKIAAYALNAPSPQDMCWLFQGASPLCFDPGTPTTAVTAAAPSAGGSVDVGTHYYGYTYYGGFGETPIGTSTSAAVNVTTGNQTVALSTIANSAQQSDCPYNASANKHLYRTKASGTGAAGSATNPWYFLANIANGTTTYTDTTADASLTNTQPPTSFTWTPAGVFGFPTAPHLAIIGMGANDINFNYSATNVTNYGLALKRLIRAIRRGQPGASILIFATYMPDAFSSDGGYWASGNSVYWTQYIDQMYRVALAENCAFINNDARWQCNAVANGFVAALDVHPNDAGNADELIPLVAALGL